jgi:hypothetical protein
MRALSLFATVAMASAVAVMPAQAQRVTKANVITVDRGEFAVTPYTGYLVSQSFLSGPLNSSLNVQGAALYGVQGSLPLAPGASLVGTVGYSSGDLKAGIPIIGGISVGTTATTLMDASVELRLEKFAQGGRFIPVVELGGGAIHRKVTVAGIAAKSTDFQVSGGLGADMPITQNVSLRFLAKDHYGKVDFGSLGSLSAKTDDLHTVALTGGVRFSF